MRYLTLTLACFILLSTAVNARELRVGVGNFEPFFIEEDERGVFLELTREVFKLIPEHTVKFVFMSNHRLLAEIREDGKIDVACNIFAESSSNAYLSAQLFRYRDIAISKKPNNFAINTIADLKSRSIAAYQGATELLGPEYKAMAGVNQEYTERSVPRDTTMMLIGNQKDVRVGDFYIFLSDINIPANKRRGVTLEDFSIHKLWPPVYSHMAFRDIALRDKVNRAIATLTQSGKIESIYARFETEYGVINLNETP